VREGPDFVLWFVMWGTAGVLVLVAISAGLFWLLKRWDDKKKAGAQRRP
jgi:hypothetical protein